MTPINLERPVILIFIGQHVLTLSLCKILICEGRELSVRTHSVSNYSVSDKVTETPHFIKF